MSLEKRLSSGEFVVLAEMNTPKGVNISELVTNARRIRGRIDAAVIPDMDNGVMRMSALGGGVLIQQQGIEAVIHVYCRDRNRMALQGDMLAAHVVGIQNLIVVRGDDMASGDHVDAKPVNDLDELGLLGAIQSLQKGVDMAGFELNGTPAFTVGCAMAPCADDKALDREMEFTQRKIAAGARFVICPPVFDLDHLVPLAKKIEALGAAVIPTVFLLKTVGIARYMATYEPGAHISEALIKRMRKSSDREMEGVKIAGEMIRDLKGQVRGVHIVTLGWEHKLPDILDHAGL
ncbi:MAG: methylenetetrahydrofolate reductase [Deltaproteobacteria bacterium]|nr:methylenetetrahydrofolate reductase [Deltaproteobacteria bacterium]